ncbi:MAG: nucleotidyltransferase family protein [Patescibacteria group bacterium]
MNHSDIIKKITPFIKRAGVKRAGLFGSVVHGTFNAMSDIDLLVDLPQETTLFDFIALKLELEDVLGRPVDLVEYGSLKPQFRDDILKDEVRVYEGK